MKCKIWTHIVLLTLVEHFSQCFELLEQGSPINGCNVLKELFEYDVLMLTVVVSFVTFIL